MVKIPQEKNQGEIQSLKGVGNILTIQLGQRSSRGNNNLSKYKGRETFSMFTVSSNEWTSEVQNPENQCCLEDNIEKASWVQLFKGLECQVKKTF